MIRSDIKTLIIGCSNIAGGFDVYQDDLIFTHAGAYKHHGKFNLTACVDPDRKKLKQFAADWKITHKFLNMQEVETSGLNFDVVSICSPTSCHHINVIEALRLKPKLIFCEKPIANTYEEAIEIKKMCEQANVLLAVNHIRRWDPNVIELKKKIEKGCYGEIRSLVGYYNKGILNNGSHMIDLLLNLFGSLNVVTAFGAVNDYFKDDPTVSAILSINSDLPVHLVAANALDYNLFELEIIGSKEIITMRDGGLNWSSRKIVENPRFKGYKNLSKDNYFENEYTGAMIGAVENIYNAITVGEQLLCTGYEACAAHKICSDISEMAILNSYSK